MVLRMIKEEKELKAFQFAQKKHQGICDDSGKDYFVCHILQVVQIVKQVTDNVDVIVAAFLHDTIEDTDTTYEEIQEKFGWTVASLVMELTHEGKKDETGYYFPRLVTKDGILIKFADRLSNLSRMESWEEARQKHYLKKSKFWYSSPEEQKRMTGLRPK